MIDASIFLWPCCLVVSSAFASTALGDYIALYHFSLGQKDEKPTALPELKFFGFDFDFSSQRDPRPSVTHLVNMIEFGPFYSGANDPAILD